MSRKFCFIISSLPRWDSRIFIRQAISLVNNGFDVSFVICNGGQSEILQGVNIIRSSVTFNNRFERFFSHKDILFDEVLSQDADVYQISEPELIGLGIKLIKNKKKVIYDVREDYPQLILIKEYLPFIFRRLISYGVKIYFRLALKKYNALLTVTPALLEKIIIYNKNAYLITNYPVVRESKCNSFESYNARRNTLCYVGTIYKLSRQEVIFKSLENIKDIQYILAGIAESKSYFNFLQSEHYWKTVKFINGLSKEEADQIYNSSTIGNSIRDFTGTGYPEGSLGIIKIFEYMEASLPIICSKVKLWEEIISKYQCGICVDPNNSQEIANAVKFLLENKFEAFIMGQNARRAIENEYNWTTQEKVYLQSINSLLNS